MKFAIAVGVCGVLVLIAIGVCLWIFIQSSPPPALAPRDTLDDSKSAGATAAAANSAPGELTVFLDKPGAAISPALFGLALEEINHSLDGGLYAELLPNRDLLWTYRSILGGSAVTTNGRTRIVGGQIIITPQYWSLDKSGIVNADMQVEVTPVPGTAANASLRLIVSDVGLGGRAGLANGGYWGIPVKPDWSYHASFRTRAGDNFSGPLTVDIETDDGKTVYAHADVNNISRSWQRYDVDLKTDKNITPSAGNRFKISTTSKGTFLIAEASLFPPTYNNRPNGNRIDLMQKLADLKPSFIIFPGGDSLNGRIVRNRFNWKNTIGPVETRSAQVSAWGRTSNGFGLMEFLLTCEDLHAEPVLGIYDGTSTGERVAPGKDLNPYVQDALDEIEYVTGDKITMWGARRAADGHPEPFPLHYLQIGNNEQLFNQETYDARFTQFHDAIKAKYPDLKLIGWMDLATSRVPEVRHESFYSTARQLIADCNHYDNYPRGGPRYATEFNAKEGDPTKTFNAALADMSWMLGVQRNADVVAMATAAPLFVEIESGAQRHPANLIGYDTLASYGSPTYYALRMFNLNKGDIVIPIKLVPPEVNIPTRTGFHGAVGVGSWGSRVEYKDIKVTAPDGNLLFQSDFSKSLDGWRIGEGNWQTESGSLLQTSDLIDCTAVAGDPTWTDYTLTLKARKISGAEGFLILVHAADTGNFVWWNIGGWGYSSTGLEQTIDGEKLPLGDRAPDTIQSDRWYDIRVRVKGGDITCFQDNAPILAATERPHQPAAGRMSAAASRDNKTGEVIVKVVNPMPQAGLVNITLAGGSTVLDTGTLEVMTGNPGDVNTLHAPQSVSPTIMTAHFPGTHFSHEFPPYSISVLRLKVK